MRTDREILELAAKAAGLSFCWDEGRIRVIGSGFTGHEPNYYYWNPLIDDGDALRLAVTLGMVVDFRQEGDDLMRKIPGSYGHVVCHDSKNPYAATRSAIVRVAAEIGAQS